MTLAVCLLVMHTVTVSVPYRARIGTEMITTGFPTPDSSRSLIRAGSSVRATLVMQRGSRGREFTRMLDQ